MWIHYKRLHNHNKAKHNKTVCIFLGIYCICVTGHQLVQWYVTHNKALTDFYWIEVYKPNAVLQENLKSENSLQMNLCPPWLTLSSVRNNFRFTAPISHSYQRPRGTFHGNYIETYQAHYSETCIKFQSGMQLRDCLINRVHLTVNNSPRTTEI